MFKFNTKIEIHHMGTTISRIMDVNGEEHTLDFLVKKYLLTGYRRCSNTNRFAVVEYTSSNITGKSLHDIDLSYTGKGTLEAAYAEILPVAGKNFRYYIDFERNIQRASAIGITLEKCACGRYSNTEGFITGIDGVRYCVPCANHKYNICKECGKVVEWIPDGKSSVCEDCVEANGLVYCELCQSFTEKETSTELVEGKFVCADCEDNAAICECCGEIVNTDREGTYVENANGWYCDNCITYRVIQCAHCEQYFDTATMANYLEDHNIMICENCMDDYCVCSECGGIIHIDNAYSHNDANYCEDCFNGIEPESNGEILPYHAPIGLNFHHKGEPSKLYFGVELEYDSYSSDETNSAVESISKEFDINSDYTDLHLEHDSSINAFEAVFQPRTLASWQQWDGLYYFAENVSGLCVNSGTGMHVHISKKAMTDEHKSAFTFFINYHSTFVEKTAERGETEYTKYIKKTTTEYHNGNFANMERREAVNWKNANTVETRVFKSTQDRDTIIARIEFLHAVYQFTKNRSIKSVRGLKNFISYVSHNKKYSTFCSVYGSALTA